MDFNDFNDLKELQNQYDEFIKTADPDVAADIADNIRRVAYCMTSDARNKKFESLQYAGKFLRIRGTFGTANEYLYCISQHLRVNDDSDKTELMLYGIFFHWCDSKYADDAYATFCPYDSVTLHAEHVMKGREKWESGDRSGEDYVEIITEDEFKTAYEKLKKFVDRDISGWIDAMRLKEDPKMGPSNLNR